MKTLKNFPVLSLTLAVSFALTACGGGSTPTSVTPPVVVTPPPPTVIPADLQLTVPAPPFAAGSDQLVAFNFVNDFRRSLGLGLYAYNEALTKASLNHVNYVLTNNSGADYHKEIATMPGFTGVNPIDRANFAGYATNNFVTEDGGSSRTLLGGMQRLIDTVYHRTTFIGQGYKDIGFSFTNIPCPQCFGTLSFNVNIGAISKQRNASDFVMVYPKNGETNVNLSMGAETPNPFPEIKIPNFPEPTTPANNPLLLIGYPITIAVEASQVLKVTSFTTTEAGQTAPLPAWLVTFDNDQNRIVQPNEANLTAKGALKPNTVYNVSFIGSANGRDIIRNWSFTTASRQLNQTLD